MKICDCKNHLEFAYIRDRALPFGDVESVAIYKCTVCGEEFSEYELEKSQE